MDAMLSLVYVFIYGSLLSRQSLRATLPGVDSDACLPAQLDGYVRTFDVAFPNDGSQPDKAYFDERGARPEIVLFANLRRVSGAAPVNGGLVPVRNGELESLIRRERRYELLDVTAGVRLTAGRIGPDQVVVFVGSPQFSRPERVRRGVVPRDYWETMAAGAAEWERRSPGFLSAFWASTHAPAPERVVALRRVDGPSFSTGVASTRWNRP